MSRTILSVIFLLLIFNSCKQNTYDKDDAIKSLKVLNSDILNFLTVGSERPEFQALQFIYNNQTSPVPFNNPKFAQKDGKFMFPELAGLYEFDSISDSFVRSATKDFIDINFKIKNDNDVNFKILEFKDQCTSSKPAFPIQLISKLFIDDKELITIDHHSKVSNDFPETLKTIIDGDGYKIQADLLRTKETEDGKISFDCTFDYLIKTILSVQFDADISYSKQGFYYNYIEFESRLFGHIIKGIIDYKEINPTSDDYAYSFNKNTNIEIFESPGKKVGNVVLGKTEGGDLNEFQIEFKNKEREPLTKYLPLLEKVYNIKQ